ncbi:PASTA domain-containing protein [uncultured Senegalimassilia sp.]|uniref:PASTA domain-containing protein n=1 Tax=uncultured Senegalimassilia sp. TaxID=1714350 RepID=UPI0027DB99B5|nr:PASTA domain-containing protein [uncultured Senegalimassilia sp.]
MICPSCHTENREGAKFCDECGAKLPRAAFEQIEGAEPAQALSIIGDEEPAEDEAVPDVCGADLESAEAADGGQDGEDVDSEPVVQLDGASASDDDAEDAGDTAYSNEEAVGEDAIDADSSDIAMQDDPQSRQDVAESTQEAEQDAANELGESHGDADDVAHQRTHVLDLPDIRNLAFESEKTQTLGPKPASPAIKSGWEPDLSGFDEFLVYPGYVPPKAAWHSGDTMQMPRITDADLSQQKDFIAPDPNKKKRDRKKKKAEKAKACESQQQSIGHVKEAEQPAAKPEKEHPKHAEKETKPVVSETKSKDDKKPESKSKRLPGSKIAAIVALVVVLAAGVAGGVTYQMELWGGKIVPDVTGMTQADATYVLQNKGFAVRSTTVPSDSTEGLVLLMDPGAGARQEEGAEVVIHVSTSRMVPKVVGSSKDSALKALSDNGFENVDVQLERSDEPEGTVLSISPEEGEKAKASTGITLKVAQAYTVPDVSGMSYNEAVQAIKDAGLSSTAVYVYSETASEGAIMGVEPAAGSKVPSDTVVVVSLAKSRASELTAAARSYLSSTTLTASDGSSFTVSSVDNVSYQGNDTVAFTASGKASKSVTVLGQTISVAGDSKQVSGTVTFDSSNNVASVSFK